jgi:hypothetical protein
MAEIEITLPTVQYGNVKVRATAEELGLEGVQDAGALGVATAVYLNLFTQGFKVGTRIDVDYDGGGAKPPTSEPTHEEAQEALSQLGTTVLDETPNEPDEEPEADAQAPWNSPTVDAKPKPWETGASAPIKVAEIDW